jgi:hypothetical protein
VARAAVSRALDNEVEKPVSDGLDKAESVRYKAASRADIGRLRRLRSRMGA